MSICFLLEISPESVENCLTVACLQCSAQSRFLYRAPVTGQLPIIASRIDQREQVVNMIFICFTVTQNSEGSEKGFYIMLNTARNCEDAPLDVLGIFLTISSTHLLWNEQSKLSLVCTNMCSQSLYSHAMIPLPQFTRAHGITSKLRVEF